MKKLFLVVLCLTIMATGAFAMDKAIGGGILYNSTFTNGWASDSYSFYGDTYSFEQDWTLNRNGYGAFAFFGINQFWELNLGFLYKDPNTLKGKYTEKLNGQKIYEETFSDNVKDDYMEGTSALQLGVYFKYPIPVNETIVFFPTVGLDFELSLDSDSVDYGDGFAWWHDFWIRAGVGLDFFLNDKTFIRSHLIYGAAIPIGGEDWMGITLGHGLLFKVGLGFMF